MYCFKPIVWKKSFNPWLHTIFAHRLQKVFLLLVKQLGQKTRIFFFVDNGTFSPASSLGYWKAIDSLGNIFILVEFEVTIYLRHDLWIFFSQHTERQGCVSRDGTTPWHLRSDRDLEQLSSLESVEAEWEFPLQCHCNLGTHLPLCKSAVNWSAGLSLSA